MTQEEKAKAYDEAIERAKKLQETCDSQAVVGWCEYIFPELCESEDERIRKEIIEFVDTNTLSVDERHNRWLAWLEKQGNSPIKWNKNTEGNKPQINHSVLMKTTHGIAEGEWNGGEHWIQYRWSSSLKDSDVLSWMELSDLEKQIEQKPAWSEEDEKMCQETIDWFEKKCFPYALESENPARESIKWLKSLKQKIGG